jgi:hypothetical protein
MFLLPRKCTTDCKLRELQYRRIYKYLPTNKKLFQSNYKLKESNARDLCGTSPESITITFFGTVIIAKP